MACSPEVLKRVPLFALLDPEETCVLAGQVEVRTFAARQRIYKMGDPGEKAYVMVSGRVRISTVDEDQQEVVVDEPGYGEFFGFASMLEQTPHHTDAIALEEAVCLEVDRNDIAVLLERKPMAGMDMLAVLGRQFHAAQQLVRVRANRAPTVRRMHRRRRRPSRSRAPRPSSCRPKGRAWRSGRRRAVPSPLSSRRRAKPAAAPPPPTCRSRSRPRRA